jgi:hypothetical protein
METKNSEKKVIDTSILDGNALYLWYREQMDSKTPFAKLDVEKQIDLMLKKNKMFALTYPLVVRMMVQYQMYHPLALKKYIKRLYQYPPKTEEAMYCGKASYVKFLYKELYPNHKKSFYDEIYETYSSQLKEELKSMKLAQAKIKEKKEEVSKFQKENLRKLILEQKSSTI